MLHLAVISELLFVHIAALFLLLVLLCVFHV